MGMRAVLREVQEGDLARLEQAEQAFALFNRTESVVLSLEKSWDGLHRLLTASGSEVELGFVYKGGTEVGAHLSYGRARLLSPDFVSRLDAALKSLSDDQFWAGFDAAKFEADDVYPSIWDEPVEELREEYVYYFHELQKFLDRAAKSIEAKCS
jgi:hypothetical protein